MRLIRLLKRDLARESRSWVREGIISEGQARSICAHYGIDYHDQGSRSHGYYVLVFLGYLFVGLSLMTLIGANWEEIPRGLRMAGLILVTLAFNSLGLRHFARGAAKAAAGWFFLGGICYGASIMLIAQIYHIGEHYPDGILWWALGVLPVALLLSSTPLMMLTTALAFAWFFVEAGLGYFPALFPLFLAALAWHVLRRTQSNVLFLALIMGAGTLAEYSLSWHLGGGHGFRFGVENVACVIALFLFFSGLAGWLSARPDHRMKDYGLLLEVWSLRFALLSLVVFSFEEPWKGMMEARWEKLGLIVFLSAVLAAAGTGLALAGRGGTTAVAAFSLYYLAALGAAVRLDPADSVMLQFFDNIVLVATAVWLIVRGIRSSVSHYFYLGILSIMATAVLRYVDLVGDYIGAALLFAFFAVILLATARYWRDHLSAPGAPP